jgi:16S rRNA (guanine527-N7)-methyltransferase
MNAESLADFSRGARAMGIDLSDEGLTRFQAYASLLARWNRAIRLTGLRDPRDWVEAHFLDSLSALASMDEPGALMDVGSGAGLPGIPLAIAKPTWRVTLLEPHAKRGAFLRAVVHELALTSVEVLQRNVEDRPEPRFDTLITRATWSPEDWLRLAAPWLRHPGRAVAMLGRTAPEDAALAALGAKVGFRLQAVRRFRLPLSGAQRAVAVWSRAAFH